MRRLYLIICLLWVCQGAWAAEEAGVEFADRVEIGDQALQLNGLGIRSKFFVKVYVGALYLPEPSTDPAAVLAMPGPKRIVMHILYKEVTREQMVEAWTEGVTANVDAEALENMRDRLDAFNAMVRTVHKGDRVRLDLLADGTLEVYGNDTRLGEIEGRDFQTAILRVFIGDKPADKGLKRGMLGQ